MAVDGKQTLEVAKDGVDVQKRRCLSTVEIAEVLQVLVHLQQTRIGGVLDAEAVEDAGGQRVRSAAEVGEKRAGAGFGRGRGCVVEDGGQQREVLEVLIGTEREGTGHVEDGVQDFTGAAPLVAVELYGHCVS